MLKRAELMKQLEEDYFMKYKRIVDFLLTKNNSFSINNNRIAFQDKETLDKYNSLQVDQDNASKLYTNFVVTLKDATTNELNDLNKKYFNIQEIDSLVNMVKYDKYK